MEGSTEETLSADGVTHVTRRGETVRRPVRPFTATIQAYLTHVRSQGFTACPEPLGYDDQGREVLSFVAGEVPVGPRAADAVPLFDRPELVSLMDYCPGNVVFLEGRPAACAPSPTPTG